MLIELLNAALTIGAAALFFCLWILGANILSAHTDMNELNKCIKCGLVHRKYQRLLHQGENVCPHCNKEVRHFKYMGRYTKEANYNYPFAPKISILKAFKYSQLGKKNEQNIHLDKQIERYLVVQEERLMEMKIKKDKLIKDGAFEE